jgi:hypothetical protein
LLGIFAVLVVMVSAGALSAQASSGTTIGPVQISVLGHPRLCWEAAGNGSAVTLEHCDRMLQGQQWSLTPDGVLMNGNGYCLEAIPGGPLLVDFAGQCAGSPSQTWHYRSGRLAGLEACAAVAAPPVPGAEIVGSSCSRPVADTLSRWSIGRSAVTLTASRGQGPVGGTFGASVTVANAASAQAAYGVSVTFALPPGVAASTLRATPASSPPGSALPGSSLPGSSLPGSSLHCDVGTLTCTGTLPAGASRRITITGPVPAAVRPGDSYPVRAHASVTGTTQRSRTARTTASLTVTVAPATPRPRSPLPLIATGAALLLLAGAILLLTTRRTHAPSRPRPSRPRGPFTTFTPVATRTPDDPPTWPQTPIS